MPACWSEERHYYRPVVPMSVTPARRTAIMITIIIPRGTSTFILRAAFTIGMMQDIGVQAGGFRSGMNGARSTANIYGCIAGNRGLSTTRSGAITIVIEGADFDSGNPSLTPEPGSTGEVT